MRRAVYLLLLALFASPALADTCATGWSSVQASKIIDLGGSLLTSGTIAITGIDAKRNIINFGAPGGGAVMKVIKKAPVSSGAIVGTVCVPRSDMATVYVRYHVVVTDNSASGTHAVVIDANDIPITSDVFSLDAYPFPADAYANPPNTFSSGHVTGDLTVTGTIYAGTIEGATAANANHANTADTATTATTATNATNATHAITADSATTATSATTAITATTAATATVANALASPPTDCGTQAINGINADGSPKSCISAGAGNPSVGSAGTPQVAGPTPGTFAASTPNIANAALGRSNGAYFFVDSLGWATGATSTGVGNVPFQNGYVYQWQQDIGGPFLIGGVPGDQEADVNFKWIYRVTNPQGGDTDPLYAHVLGTNDAIAYMGDTNKQAIFQRLNLGSLAWLGTPRANKIFAQNCTLAGGMAVDAAPLQVGLGAKATTNGATASCVINNPKANGTIFACYLIQDGNGGTLTLSLDGTPQTDPFNGTTTWYASGDGGALIKTQNNVTAGVACARFTGISSGNHTVLFTVTSATGASNAVWPQWVGAAPISSTLNPYVPAVSPNQQQSGSAGAPYVATYVGFINTIVANLAADGENISYSDTSNALLNDPNCGNGVQATMFTKCYSDNVHLNNVGYASMHNRLYADTPSSFLLGATRWSPKQPLQSFLPASPLTPYQWLDVNPYHISCTTTFCPGIKLQGANGQFSGINFQNVTGTTFYSPGGVTKWSFCDWGSGGFMGTGPPPLSACSLIGGNGKWDFFQGATASNGMTIQGNLMKTGSSFVVEVPGTLRADAGSGKHGVYSVTLATSGANNNSPCWYFMGGVWNMILGQGGFDGPCLQGVLISPTPAGKSGQGYLTLQPGGTVTEVGLDLRNTVLPNYLGSVANVTTLNATTVNVNGSPVTAPIILTTTSIGGSALAAGACSSTTLTQSGTGGSSRVLMTPSGGGPGAGYIWQAFVSSSNTITAQVCAIVAGTPAANIYTLEVHP